MSGVDSAATVTYSLTHEDGTFTGTIAPGEVEIFTQLPVTLRHVGSGLANKAIKISASSDIVVYGINKQTWSTDGFLAFPVDVVGTEYYSAHYFPGEFTKNVVFLQRGKFAKIVEMKDSHVLYFLSTSQCISNDLFLEPLPSQVI